jgi:hypothetical protein
MSDETVSITLSRTTLAKALRIAAETYDRCARREDGLVRFRAQFLSQQFEATASADAIEQADIIKLRD